MNYACRVWLAGQDVSAWVVTEDFPDWIESSVKGPGYFDWQTKPFEFRIHESCPVAPAVGQTVVITILTNMSEAVTPDWQDVQRFSGLVDEIRDIRTPTPMITAQARAVTLKDVMAGTPGVNPLTNEERFWFEIPQPGVTIQEAAEQVVAAFNVNKADRIPATTWIVDVQGGADDPLAIHSPHGLTGPVRGAAVGDTFYDDQFWKTYYRDFGGYPLTLAEHYPEVPRLIVLRHLATGRLAIGRWFPNYFMDQLQHWILLSADAQWYQVATFPADGQPDDGHIAWSTPGHVGGESNGSYVPDGYEEIGFTSAYVTQEQAVQYVRAYVGISEDEILAGHAALDTPAGTWTIVYRQVPLTVPGYNLADSRFYVTWWGNPLEQVVSGRWPNHTMADMLKLFAMVSGRWLAVTDSTISMIPRNSSAGSVPFPDEDRALALDEKRRTASPSGDVNILVLNRDDAESTGLDFTLGRVAALQFYYVDRFSGVTVERESQWLTDDAPKALALLVDSGTGQVIELGWSVDGLRWKAMTIQEGT